MNCLIRKILKAPPPKKAGTTKGRNVSTQPISLNMMNIGIIVTWDGSIIVASSTRNSALFPRKLNRANP
ncbi:hypothetical protein D1872_293840 [compost metagenome]